MGSTSSGTALGDGTQQLLDPPSACLLAKPPPKALSILGKVPSTHKRARRATENFQKTSAYESRSALLKSLQLAQQKPYGHLMLHVKDPLKQPGSCTGHNQTPPAVTYQTQQLLKQVPTWQRCPQNIFTHLYR